MNTNISPITALQELMAAAGKPLPLYKEGFDKNGNFLYSVYVNGITATGAGFSKKTAKHTTAEKALAVLRKQTDSPLQFTPKPFKNCISELNEYCSKAGVGYADYGFVSVTVDMKFVVRCVFAGMETQGVGRTMKDAKRAAAGHMIEKVKTDKFTPSRRRRRRHRRRLQARYEIDDANIAEIFNKLTIDFTAKRNNLFYPD